MSIEANKAIVQRLTEAMNAQDYDTIDALATPEVAKSTKEITRWVHATFAGHHETVTDMIAEEDKIAARYATRGGHSGEGFEGLPPTGKQWTNTGVIFYRIADGKIVEMEGLFDVLNHLKQLGGTVFPSTVPNT